MEDVFAFGCGACGDYLDKVDAHSTIFLDSTFTTDETNDIISGVQEWETATNGQVQFDVKMMNHDTLVSMRHPESNQLRVIKYAAGGCKITAGYDQTWFDNGVYICFNTDPLIYNKAYGTNPFQLSMAHETGHALGLEHYEGNINGLSVMTPTALHNAMHVTSYDVHNAGF